MLTDLQTDELLLEAPFLTRYRFRPRKEVRREEIYVLRAQGRAAYLQGKHVQTNPHRYCNSFQWWQGYKEAEEEACNEPT